MGRGSVAAVGILRRRRPRGRAGPRQWFLRIWFTRGPRVAATPARYRPDASLDATRGAVRVVRGLRIAIVNGPRWRWIASGAGSGVAPDAVLLGQRERDAVRFLHDRGYRAVATAAGTPYALYAHASLAPLEALARPLPHGGGVAVVLRLRCRVRFDPIAPRIVG